MRSHTNSELHDVAVNRNGAVVVVGDNGALVRSVDGGATWSEQVSKTPDDFMSVVATPSGAFVAVGLGGVIVRSADDGATWSIDQQEGELWSVTVEPKGALTTGAGEGVILRSADDGKSWSSQRAGETCNSMVQAATPDSVMLAACDEGAIFRTEDRGVTWTLAKFPWPATESYRRRFTITRLCVVTSKLIVGLGNRGTSNLTSALVMSVDAGATWTELPATAATRHLVELLVVEP
jgi:photosystem II stability/assembly factor-like uncharacterized protein